MAAGAFHTPFVDRFAYPILVRRGHGYLRSSRVAPLRGFGEVSAGWRLDPPDYDPPGSSCGN